MQSDTYICLIMLIIIYQIYAIVNTMDIVAKMEGCVPALACIFNGGNMRSSQHVC